MASTPSTSSLASRRLPDRLSAGAGLRACRIPGSPARTISSRSLPPLNVCKLVHLQPWYQREIVHLWGGQHHGVCG
jgi:hypothetical protein